MILCLAAFIDHQGRRRDAEGTWDAIVVPGANPGDALLRRVQGAVELWRRGRAPRIVLTGGVSVPSEAARGAAHARSLGVPDHALVLEERSTSTAENAAFAANILPVDRILVVTDTFHALRCRLVFRRHFPEVVVVGVVPPPRTRVRWALREVFVLPLYWATGKLG